MKILISKDSTTQLLLILLIVSFTILETFSWGKYFFLLLSILLYLVHYYFSRRIDLRIDTFFYLLLSFCIYCILSMLWSINPSDSLDKGITIIEIGICFLMVYTLLSDGDGIILLLNSIKWAGLIIALYSFVYYGFIEVIQAITSVHGRLANEFSNVNYVGLICAVSGMLFVYEFLFYKNVKQIICLIPLLMIIAATQSRKALVYFFFGSLLLLLLQNIDKPNTLKNISKSIASLVAIVLLLFIIYKVGLFPGIFDRMEALIDTFTNDGYIDSSTYTRNVLIDIGINSWREKPILGYGIGTSHIIVNESIGHDYYFHSNYVELLACGGILGFVTYYAIYLFLFYRLIKYRNNNLRLFSIGFVWLFLMLIMDYGMVTYYLKLQWFYLMGHFLLTNSLKTNRI